MKFFALLFSITIFTVSLANAQLREDINGSSEYSGVVSTNSQTSSNNWMSALNMTMNHSYSMTFSSFGGQTQNINAYTNSMRFDISDRLDAQLNVSFLHSPFGNSFLSNESIGSRIIIDSARFDYQLSENAAITVEFSQRPYRYSPFGRRGYGFANGFHSSFDQPYVR